MSEVFLITYNPTTDEEALTMDKATAIQSAYKLSKLLLRCRIKIIFLQDTSSAHRVKFYPSTSSK